MTAAVEVLHGLLAVALAAWAIQHVPTLRRPGLHRALWSAMAAIALGEALHVEWVYRRIDAATGPGWAAVICDSTGIIGALAVLDLLHGLLGHPRRSRLINAALGVAALTLAALPWLLSPPTAVPAPLRGYPTYYDTTWRSALHWAAMLSYLGWALGSASWQCARHARAASPGRLRTGIRLVSVGTALGLSYVVGHTVIEAAWWLHRGASLAGSDAAMDALTLGPTIGIIATGAVWQQLGDLTDRLRDWRAACATRRRVTTIRPYWAWLVDELPDISPFPEDVLAPATSPDRLGWQQSRLVLEIYDAMRRLVPYVGEDDRAVIAAKVAAHGLRGPDAEAAVNHICTRLSVQRRATNARAPTLAREPHLEAATTAAAAARVAAHLSRLRRRRVQTVMTAVLLEERP